MGASLARFTLLPGTCSGPKTPPSHGLTGFAAIEFIAKAAVWAVAGLARHAAFPKKRKWRFHGLPGGTRTPDLLLRRQLLYPVELRAGEAPLAPFAGGRAAVTARQRKSKSRFCRALAHPCTYRARDYAHGSAFEAWRAVWPESGFCDGLHFGGCCCFRYGFDSGQARQTVRWRRFSGLLFAIEKRAERVREGDKTNEKAPAGRGLKGCLASGGKGQARWLRMAHAPGALGGQAWGRFFIWRSCRCLVRFCGPGGLRRHIRAAGGRGGICCRQTAGAALA